MLISFKYFIAYINKVIIVIFYISLSASLICYKDRRFYLYVLSEFMKMQILSFNFLLYTVGGIWRPIEWYSNEAKMLYSTYTIFVLSSLYFLVLTQFMDIVLIVDNVDDFTTNSLMFLTIVAVSCKATVVVVRRNAIINLVQVLLKSPYKFLDTDEMTIQRKFDKFIKYVCIHIIIKSGNDI